METPRGHQWDLNPSWWFTQTKQSTPTTDKICPGTMRHVFAVAHRELSGEEWMATKSDGARDRIGVKASIMCENKNKAPVEQGGGREAGGSAQTEDEAMLHDLLMGSCVSSGTVQSERAWNGETRRCELWPCSHSGEVSDAVGRRVQGGGFAWRGDEIRLGVPFDTSRQDVGVGCYRYEKYYQQTLLQLRPTGLVHARELDCAVSLTVGRGGDHFCSSNATSCGVTGSIWKANGWQSYSKGFYIPFVQWNTACNSILLHNKTQKSRIYGWIITDSRSEERSCNEVCWYVTSGSGWVFNVQHWASFSSWLA